ncbi:MAG: hypothetical protein AAB914_01265 [Patescibacteria group bacterium]
MEELKQLLADYRPSDEVIEIVKSSKLLFVVGISGAGKNTIINRLLESGDYHRIISHTTRAPRENYGVLEQDGYEYHFIDDSTVTQMIENKEFVEAKLYGHNVYGTSAREIQKAKDENKIAITDIEVQGVQEYWNLSQNIKVVFIVPPDYDTWQTRLTNRYKHGIDQEDLSRRKRIAREEIELALSKDYFQFVVNDDLPRAVHAVDRLSKGGESDQEYQQKGKDIAQRIVRNLG